MASNKHFVTVRLSVERGKRDGFLGTLYLLKALFGHGEDFLGTGADKRDLAWAAALREWLGAVHLPSIDGPHPYTPGDWPSVPEAVGVGRALGEEASDGLPVPEGASPLTVWDTPLQDGEESLYQSIKGFFADKGRFLTHGMSGDRAEELARFVLHYAQELRPRFFDADQFWAAADRLAAFPAPDGPATGHKGGAAFPLHLGTDMRLAQMFHFRRGAGMVPTLDGVTRGGPARFPKGYLYRTVSHLHEQCAHFFPDLSQHAPGHSGKGYPARVVVGYTCSLLGHFLDEEAFLARDKGKRGWCEYLAQRVRYALAKGELHGG